MNVPRRGRALLPLLLAACASPPPPPPPPPPEVPWEQRTLAAMTLERRAGQLLVAAGAVAADSAALREATRDGTIGGVLLDSLAARPTWLPPSQGDSLLPLLVMVDLDRLGGMPPVRAIAALAATSAARAAGVDAARRARSSGAAIGLFRTPPTNRRDPLDPLARDPVRLQAGVRAYLDGLRAGGVLGAAHTLWTDTAGVAAVGWGRVRLEALELRTLQALRQDSVAALGPGALRMRALAGDTLPLPLSPAAVRGLLRRDLAYDGVIFADLSAGSALRSEYGEADAAVRAVAAGVDLLVGVSDPRGVRDALVRATRSGRIPAARIDEAAARLLSLKARTRALAALPPAAPADSAALAAVRALPRGADSPTVALPGHRWPPAPTLEVAGAGAVGMSEQRLSLVDRTLRQALDDSVFTAAAVAIGRRGRLVRLRGYGRVAGPGSPPVDPRETVFDLASLTKVVGTTTATAVLVEEGRMALDAPVRRYLPEFRGGGRGEVTVRHLLTHTSGLPSGLWLFGEAASARGALERVLEQPLRNDPGRVVEYSDLGMILLAEAVERAAEMPLDRFLALRLFAPLGMASTQYLPPAALRPRTVPTAGENERDFVLRGVVHDANAFRLGGVAGHAGLFGTALDLAVFAQTMLNGGSYGTARVLAPGTVRAFTARQRGAKQRALGWDTPGAKSSSGRFFSARTYGHTGYTGTSLWIDPEKELFVVLLTNRTYAGASAGEIFRLRAAVHDAAARAIETPRARPARPRPRRR